MARYVGPDCRLCRREGMQLYLKGDRCYTDKCAIERRHYPPGQHGQRRSKLSDYGAQLREKQKVKRIYGVLEKQFSSYFEKAERQKGVTGTNLLVFLERRLDNIVYRLGFANSRTQARQLVRHNFFQVNGTRVNLPSFLVKTGDVIVVTEKGRNLPLIQGCHGSGGPARLPSLVGVQQGRGPRAGGHVSHAGRYHHADPRASHRGALFQIAS